MYMYMNMHADDALESCHYLSLAIILANSMHAFYVNGFELRTRTLVQTYSYYMCTSRYTGTCSI